MPVCAFRKMKVLEGHLLWVFYNIANHCQTSLTCLHPEFPRSSVFALLCEVLIKATRNIFSSLRSYSNFNQLFILTHCVCCLLLYLVSSHRSEEISSPRLSREPSLVIYIEKLNFPLKSFKWWIHNNEYKAKEFVKISLKTLDVAVVWRCGHLNLVTAWSRPNKLV